VKTIAALSDGWTRFSDLKKTTGLGAATLTRHLRALVADGSAERRVDTESGTHPPPTYYRLTPPGSVRGGKASVTLSGLTRIKMGASSQRPSTVYADRHIPLDDVTSGEISEMLRKAEDLLAELQLTLVLEERRSKLARLLAGVEGFEEVLGLEDLADVFFSLEGRYERAGVVGSAGEEAEIRSREEEYLKRYDASHAALERDARVWVFMNRELRDTPLTSEGFGAYCERRRRLEGLIEPKDLGRLLAESNPVVCLVAASEGVRVVSEGS
jgi:DNA-binding transcriptional ArsR family regulator